MVEKMEGSRDKFESLIYFTEMGRTYLLHRSRKTEVPQQICRSLWSNPFVGGESLQEVKSGDDNKCHRGGVHLIGEKFPGADYDLNPLYPYEDDMKAFHPKRRNHLFKKT